MRVQHQIAMAETKVQKCRACNVVKGLKNFALINNYRNTHTQSCFDCWRRYKASPPNPPGKKTCISCLMPLDLCCFDINTGPRASVDGYHGKCRQCNNADRGDLKEESTSSSVFRAEGEPMCAKPNLWRVHPLPITTALPFPVTPTALSLPPVTPPLPVAPPPVVVASPITTNTVDAKLPKVKLCAQCKAIHKVEMYYDDVVICKGCLTNIINKHM